MTIGPEGGTAAALGICYREILARDAVTMRLVPTAGAVASAALLRDAKSGVSISILPGGITNEKESPGLVSLGTLFYEPLWLFVRDDADAGQETLRNLRISIGPEGSGSRALAREFFAWAGIIDQVSDHVLPLLPSESTDQLLRGEIDGVLLLSAWDTADVRNLLARHNIPAEASRPRRCPEGVWQGPGVQISSTNRTGWPAV